MKLSHLSIPALACVLALAACQHGAPRNPMATWVPSPNHDLRRPQLVVIHYTEQESVARSLATLRTRNAGGRVSAHYLIGRDGRIYQLVSDRYRAWHAGAGSWGTIHELNSASIGIELDNNGREPFPEAQIEALLRLLEDLAARHRLPKSAVIGHSDLAPGRKIDPGPLFPWKRLFDAGFGIWPDPDAPPPPPGFDPILALFLGFTIGVGASLFGVGGGIFQVPAMVLLMRMPSHIATSTSTFVLMFTGATGALVHLVLGHYSGLEAEELSLATGSLFGAQIGAVISRHLASRQEVITRFFSLALLIVAARMLLGAFL